MTNFKITFNNFSKVGHTSFLDQNARFVAIKTHCSLFLHLTIGLLTLKWSAVAQVSFSLAYKTIIILKLYIILKKIKLLIKSYDFI